MSSSARCRRPNRSGRAATQYVLVPTLLNLSNRATPRQAALPRFIDASVLQDASQLARLISAARVPQRLAWLSVFEHSIRASTRAFSSPQRVEGENGTAARPTDKKKPSLRPAANCRKKRQDGEAQASPPRRRVGELRRGPTSTSARDQAPHRQKRPREPRRRALEPRFVAQLRGEADPQI